MEQKKTNMLENKKYKKWSEYKYMPLVYTGIPRFIPRIQNPLQKILVFARFKCSISQTSAWRPRPLGYTGSPYCSVLTFSHIQTHFVFLSSF